ncbi:hypothetical protein AURDEDRAFT_154259 [Auricularia subglabra TFB-10046 SS5]|nr:hypothetical protein AURDEDRAFT_154259 [Auricularia subglabra TFB-10046 SS5]
MLSRLLTWSLGSSRRTHINRLPPELLGEVFMHLPLSDRIRAATVCTLWRAVALDHAELWCDLENVRLGVLPHLLARTKQAGVHLSAHDLILYEVPLICCHIHPHMGHMRYLDLQVTLGFDCDEDVALTKLLGSPAPALETFMLVVKKVEFPIDFVLFGGVAPKLRTMRMEGWSLETPSAATRNVVTLQAPGMVYDLEESDFALHTKAWSQMFPKVRELHLSHMSRTIGLWSPENPFPTNLTTLVLELTLELEPQLLDEPFALLQQANFTNLRELTIAQAHPALIDRVLQTVDAADSLELLGYGGTHVRLITSTGAALNFMHAYHDGLIETVLRRSKIFEGLRELHLDELAPQVFEPYTIAHICLTARQLARLRITLRPGARGFFDPALWGRHGLLSLRGLRELRIEGAPRAWVFTDELADFVGEVLRVSSHRDVDWLTLVGVEIVDHLERCAVSGETLDRILDAHFSDVIYEPTPRVVIVVPEGRVIISVVHAAWTDLNPAQLKCRLRGCTKGGTKERHILEINAEYPAVSGAQSVVRSGQRDDAKHRTAQTCNALEMFLVENALSKVAQVIVVPEGRVIISVVHAAWTDLNPAQLKCRLRGCTKGGTKERHILEINAEYPAVSGAQSVVRSGQRDDAKHRTAQTCNALEMFLVENGAHGVHGVHVNSDTLQRGELARALQDAEDGVAVQPEIAQARAKPRHLAEQDRVLEVEAAERVAAAPRAVRRAHADAQLSPPGVDEHADVTAGFAGPAVPVEVSAHHGPVVHDGDVRASEGPSGWSCVPWPREIHQHERPQRYAGKIEARRRQLGLVGSTPDTQMGEFGEESGQRKR